jgi:hypothetical protein
MKTASSFDVSWASTNLTLDAYTNGSTTPSKTRTLSSLTGLQIDYDVALFDLRTVVSASFAQFMTSNLGSAPFNRVSLGVSYHFLRVNGQRVVMDNEVEGKIWGISPALELSLGVNKLSIKDPSDANFDFTSSLVDFMPRLLIEIPLSSNYLLLLRGGYYTTLSTNGQFYDIKAHGMVLSLGLKLTTL